MGSYKWGFMFGSYTSSLLLVVHITLLRTTHERPSNIPPLCSRTLFKIDSILCSVCSVLRCANDAANDPLASWCARNGREKSSPNRIGGLRK